MPVAQDHADYARNGQAPETETPEEAFARHLGTLDDDAFSASVKRARFESGKFTADDASAGRKASVKRRFGGRRASAVERRSIEWLWNRFLPLGALSLLYGPEGDGKSVFTAMLAARVTLGTLPGELEGEPAGVEIVAFEDDAEAVLRPRLEAAGANLDLVTIHDDDEAGALLTLPDDVEDLEGAIEERASRLVIVDPLPDALREGLKDNNNGDVRKGIVPLHRMAQRLGVAVVGVSHPNKGATDPANKVMGSKAWRSVPRSVILYGRDPDDVEGATRIAAVSKANYSDKPACKVRISSAEVDGVKGTVPRAEVVGASNYRDADLLVVNATGAHGETKGLSKEKRAEHLLYRLLEEGGGEVEARVAYAAGDAVEIGEATVRRARQEIGAEGGKVWRLPDRLPV